MMRIKGIREYIGRDTEDMGILVILVGQVILA